MADDLRRRLGAEGLPQRLQRAAGPHLAAHFRGLCDGHQRPR